MASDHLPDELKPFIQQLQPSSEPHKVSSQSFDPRRKSQILPTSIFSQLIKRINSIFPDDGCTYVPSHQWRRKDASRNIAPINARFEPLNSFHADAQVTYSTYHTNPKNAFIQYCITSGEVGYGQIEQIFNHSRVTAGKRTLNDTWFVVNRLPPIPSNIRHPFSRLDKFQTQLELCLFTPQGAEVIHISKIISHCAWIIYSPEDISTALDNNYIALVSLDR